jgi:acetolactate synthase-1/2/3 large subunit
VEWLLELGYTHCFFVAGGNIMHLLDGVRQRMTCVPFVHEFAAGVAVEYFNESRPENSGRAFALVTAGPGLTNVVSAVAGAWLESRELLVIGGTVKSSDLSRGEIRQRGIQEIDGVAITKSITVVSERIEAPVSKATFVAAVRRGEQPRKGPVFLEICLDAQGAPVERESLEQPTNAQVAPRFSELVQRADAASDEIAALIRRSQRPVLLLGGGIERATTTRLAEQLRTCGVALMTTWNGADRVDARAANYFGRPNQWGQRYANVLIQQADCIVALGTRLGLQQTGFNWQEFGDSATIVHVDVDPSELKKGHPRTDIALAADANTLLANLLSRELGEHSTWLEFCREVRATLPLQESLNETAPGFIDPFVFADQLSRVCGDRDVVVPCSSGGAFTTMMQAFLQRAGQTIITDKGLAAMGYGLSGAIGAALANPHRRTVLVEGDGGFTQNLQELATVAVNALPLKIFIYSNEGYASIRMTQKNYFGGEYLGCDTNTGLGFPNWLKLFDAYGLPSLALDERGVDTPGFSELFASGGPACFVVPIDPEQTYFPKISSRVTASGGMESAPLQSMSPPLPEAIEERVLRHKNAEGFGLPVG